MNGKREIRSHLGNARLVSLSKKKKKEHIAFETFIDTDKFFRSKLFFRSTIKRVSENLRFSNNWSCGLKIQWIEYAPRGKKRKGEKFYRICTINMEGLVFITDLKNWQSTRKNPLVFKESAIDWKKEGRNNSWPSFNDSSIIPLVNDFQILQEERNESPTLSRIESKTSSQHRLIIDPRNNVYR